MEFINIFYYNVLGIKQDATTEEISKAFTSAIFKSSNIPREVLYEARTTLCHSDTRLKYNKFLEDNKLVFGSDEFNKLYEKWKETNYNVDKLEEILNEYRKSKDMGTEKNIERKEEKKESDKEEKVEKKETTVKPEKEEAKEEVKPQVTPQNSAAPVEKSSEIKFQENKKQSNVQRIVKTAIKIGVPIATGIAFGPIVGGIAGGVITVASVISTKAKLKLQKQNRPIEIKGISNDEIKSINEYNAKLEKEINGLLSKQSDNYKLEICKRKYENQIALLKRMLEIRSAKKIKNSFDAIKHKFEMVRLSNMIEDMEVKYHTLTQGKNQDFESRRLASLNQELITKTKELEAAKTSGASFKLRRLEVRQAKLFEKRNQLGTRIKTSVIRDSKVYDSFIKAKSFVTSIPAVFKSDDKVQEQIFDVLEEPVEERGRSLA